MRCEILSRRCYQIFSTVFVVTIGAVLAAPLPPMKPVTVEGTVEIVQWSPDTKIPGRPGFSGSLGKDRVDPAHFRIKLCDYRGVDPTIARRLNALLGEVDTVREPDDDRPPPRLWLKLNNDDPHALVPGMRIRVRNYVVSGDEGGTWTRFDKLDLLSKDAKPCSDLRTRE